MKPPKLVNISPLESIFGRAQTLLFVFTSVHKAVTSLFAFLFVMCSLKSNCYKTNGRGIFASVEPWDIKYALML